jgi:hypothetical protein
MVVMRISTKLSLPLGFLLMFLLSFLLQKSQGFTPSPNPCRANTGLGAAPTDSSKEASSKASIFPVLSKIAGQNWEGACRYVNEDLKPASFKLSGGIRFDLLDGGKGDMLELNSFLVFPNGNRRDIQMRGQRGSLERASMRLDPTSSEGPIYTVLTEVQPDTVLINEVEKVTGRIVMTSSLSLVPGTDSNVIHELVQVSHEVGSEPPSGKEKSAIIEGHQIWRLYKK